jgi:hypothetical protein
MRIKMWKVVEDGPREVTPSRAAGGMKNKKIALIVASGLLAIAAGLLIVNSGFHTKGVMLSVLSNPTAQHTVSNFPEPIKLLASFAVLILSATVAFGGLLVVIGGILILARHIFLGKLLVLLGGGFGFLGIAIVLGYNIMVSGSFSFITTHIEYWTGLVVATLARILAGKSQKP